MTSSISTRFINSFRFATSLAIAVSVCVPNLASAQYQTNDKRQPTTNSLGVKKQTERTATATHNFQLLSYRRPTKNLERSLQFPTRFETANRAALPSETTKFSLSGDSIIEFNGNAFNPNPVAYSMKSEAGIQSGTSLRVSDPVIDESEKGKTTWTYEAIQGPNPSLGGEALHVFHLDGGMVFAEWKAAIRLEIDNLNGEITQTWTGKFNIVGGTRKYREAAGSWDFAMMTEPNQNELSSIALFEFSGATNVVELQTKSMQKSEK